MIQKASLPDAAAQTLAGDVKSAQSLRGQLRGNREEGLRAAAREFEALFLQMMLKSMRETTAQDGLTDSDATRFFTGMLDEQMSKNISGKGHFGLAEMLEKQLSRQVGGNGEILNPENTPNAMTETHMSTQEPNPANFAAALSERLAFAALRNARVEAARNSPSAESRVGHFEKSEKTPREFVREIWPHAVEASRQTGIPPQFLIAHAALESGWGRQDIRNADGSPTYNIFGVKAGNLWQGKSTEILTTEYENGRPISQRARFRAYDSYADAFGDYARLLSENPRYGAVIGSQNGTEFAKRLQQAGYASDPKYAEKLDAVIHGAALRQALFG
ncbi:MAG: flagellar assembly peptidoglycan hydrolase FlgJ [Zoogloeaceae bacterium]|jgi:flagellar protein FlgJ|nr:flagellar assembly peptidoglycan hydrolase FlgJ [Zoogloeaceae bacterium]